MLPIEVISRDAELESAIERDTEQLAELRWHWTLDESNPDRVTFAEYAKHVGRAESTIRAMVNGYASWLDDNTTATRRGDAVTPARSVSDHLGKARFKTDRGAAAEAVAKARGLSVRGVSDPGTKHHTEVRHVAEVARERAAEHGTTIEEEADKYAKSIVRHEEAEREGREQRAKNVELRALKAEHHVLAAKREVAKAISELAGVQLDDDTTELLVDSFNKLRDVIGLLETRLTGGVSGVDWDAELAKLSEKDK